MTKYKIIQKIGTGAFGNVYLLQTNRSKKFALKTVNTLRLLRKEEECCAEGTLMLKLCHDHLVHCYDAFLCSPHLYLILELCTHGSLEQYIQGRKSLVSERQICCWMAQMADVLRYLHALKVIHRDLKPANVFLDEKENIKLGDLGVARELDHTAQERHTAAGTLPYMSPEAFCGLPYNFKTDIWSLGCCIHETMTLNKTFQGHSWAELHHMITSGQIPAMATTYHPKLCDLVLSLLNVDSNNRPDALNILHILFKIQGKRFSSEPFQPMSVEAFDQKQICHAVKTFELSSENDTILPLRDGAEGSHEESKLTDNDTVNRSEFRSFTNSNETDNHIQQRPLPVPKARSRKKKKILKTLANIANSIDSENKIDETTRTDAFDSGNHCPEDGKDGRDLKADHALLHQNSSTTSSLHLQSSYLVEDEEFFSQSQDSSHSNSRKGDEWTQEYIDSLAKDSIKWLRERFKPREHDTLQISNSQSPDGEEIYEEEDDEEVTGLITLFTQSQTAVYIHRHSHLTTNNARDDKLQ